MVITVSRLGTVRRPDEHQADSSAVSRFPYDSYDFSHGAHRANEHHGQRLLSPERENRLGKSISAHRIRKPEHCKKVPGCHLLLIPCG